jgi:hypothetical protein
MTTKNQHNTREPPNQKKEKEKSQPTCFAHAVEDGDGFFGSLGDGADGHDFLEGGGVRLQAQGNCLVD